MNERPLVIFDLDGTLADMRHRAPYIFHHPDIHTFPAEEFKKDWDGFHARTLHDKPLWDNIFLFNIIQMFCDIKIFTGRNSVAREDTIEWLDTHMQILNLDLTMRNDKDRRPDTVVKVEMYNALSYEDKGRLLCVFEDRSRVVEMWRLLGVTCHQVAPGDF